MWGLETRRKALQESATFLQRSFFDILQCSCLLAAAQLLVEMTSALQKSECCSATSLSFLSLVFLILPRKNLKLTKDFSPLPNPQKPWKNQRKRTNNQGNSLLKINQGMQRKKPRKGRTGFCSATFRKLQRHFRFHVWHVAGLGFRGVGFRTC